MPKTTANGLAAARIGELQAARGQWRGAATWLDRAAGEHQGIYRLDWLLQGRGRFFRELGEDPGPAAPPTLIPASP